MDFLYDEKPGEESEKLLIDIEGVNGFLPNQDVVNGVVAAVETAWPTYDQHPDPQRFEIPHSLTLKVVIAGTLRVENAQF